MPKLDFTHELVFAINDTVGLYRQKAITPFEYRVGKILMENAWQYSKVYAEHLSNDNDIKDKYFKWANAGWESNYAHRYPMGKNSKSPCSLIGMASDFPIPKPARKYMLRFMQRLSSKGNISGDCLRCIKQAYHLYY